MNDIYATREGELVHAVPHRCLSRVINRIGQFFGGCKSLRRFGVANLSSESIHAAAQAKHRDLPPLDEGPFFKKGEEVETKENVELLDIMCRYRKPLDILLSDIETVGNLSWGGRLMSKETLVRILGSRMRAMYTIRRDFTRLSSQNIKAPIFITGIPRTGTTLTFNLLSSSPEARFVKHWQAILPYMEEKYAKRELTILHKALNYIVPSLQSVHAFQPDLPEECLIILESTLIDFFLRIYWNAPNYQKFLEDPKTDFRGAYRYHKFLLQYLQDKYPTKSNQWVLKTPVHLGSLDALFEVYPDARIVWCHRDLKSVIPSFCSLVMHFMSLFVNHIDLGVIRGAILKKVNEWTTKAVNYRRQHPERFCDLDYKDLRADPIGCMKAVYQRFDKPFTEEDAQAMQQTLNDQPQHKYGVHRYSLEQFGLTEDMIYEACEPYIKEFGEDMIWPRKQQRKESKKQK